MTLLTVEGDALNVDVNDNLAVGNDVEAAVRPEKIYLSTEPPHGENSFPGVVVDHAFSGAGDQVLCSARQWQEHHGVATKSRRSRRSAAAARPTPHALLGASLGQGVSTRAIVAT